MPLLTPKPNRVIQMIGVLIMAASVVVIMASGAPIISDQGVRQRLDQFAAHVYDHASKDGKEGKFTYGAVEMHGWGYNKFARIGEVSLEMAEKSLLDTTRWTFSTISMDVQPDPVNPHNLIFVFPSPINVIKNGQLKTTVSFSQPLRYSYFDGQENNSRTIRHALIMPPQMTLVPGHPVDSAQPVGPITISYDANALVQFKTMPEKHERSASYGFAHIRAVNENMQVTIESLSTSFNEKPGADGRPEGTYRLDIKDLTLQERGKASKKPYSLGLDLSYLGDQPALALRDLTPSAGNAKVTLNQLFLSSDDFRIKAAGSFVLSVDDPLPYGNVQVDIENVQQLLASELLPESMRKSLAFALQKTTGQPAISLKNAALPIKREMKGVMYVGTVTFEELVASMLADMMKPPARPPVLPPPMPSETVPASGAIPAVKENP